MLSRNLHVPCFCDHSPAIPSVAACGSRDMMMRMSTAIQPFFSGKQKLVALTAYSHPIARLLDDCGIDLILVGDSLGMVEHGREDTTSVTMEEMLLHTRSVRRGVKNTLLATDLPFGTYKTSSSALENAKLLIEAGADAVKLEGGTEVEEIVRHLVDAGIPVLGHIGMLPQRIKEEGRYRIKGRSAAEKLQLRGDAAALERAGAFGMILELVEPALTGEITAASSIPTIGIGSGPDCTGQILVTYDLIGLTPWFKPAFVEPRADTANVIQAAVKNFASEVRGPAGGD